MMVVSLKAVFIYSLFILLLLGQSCKGKDSGPLFTLMENTGIQFTNTVVDGELENSFLFRNFYNGGGVAIGDVNNDGLADVFLTSNMGENKLFENKGNFQFEDVTKRSGITQDGMWSTGVVFVDINGDGWLDIYVSNSGHMTTGHRRNKLYVNLQNGSFKEDAARFGLDISAYTTQASFFDYDLDGDLDCFIIANSPMPVNTLGYANRRDLMAKDWPVEPFVRDGGDHLYRNDNGKFIEVSESAGIHGTLMSFGLGVSVGDVNMDGYPDIFVSNDSYERDYLYINQRNGTFKDEFESCMQQTSFSSMGADVADINNDGYPDIFTTDMLPEDDYRLKTLGAFDNIDIYNKKVELGFHHQFMKNCLQLNNRNGTFSEIANYSGVDATDWSWGALMFDADNDGYNDIYVCNGVNKDVTNLDFMNFFANDVIQKMVLTGKKDNVDEVLKHIPVQPMKNKVYKNKGNLQFDDVGDAWGFGQETFSNGAAYGDLDNDGDLDLVVNNENQPSFVFRNNTASTKQSHYLGFILRDSAPNVFAIGAKILLYQKGSLLLKEIMPSRGFQSSVDYKQIFGLGRNTQVDSVKIVWPDLSVTNLNPATVDTVLTINKGALNNSVYKINHSTTSSAALFNVVEATFSKHEEDNYVDFYYERNIPAMISREGPKAAIADVDGDGLSDVYVCGSVGQPGQLYIQDDKGGFHQKEQLVFSQFADFEEVAATFFDADKDGDVDLVIGPGGNNQPANTRQMQLRLLKNDGKGVFTIDVNAFPVNNVNVAVAVAGDFDKDGDEDLFIGGRSVPRNYGQDAESYVMLNNGEGRFINVATQRNPELATIGMVTTAAWIDVTEHAGNELIIAGEWMTPRIFSWQKNRFVEIKTNLDDKYGWWQSMAIVDMDKDGRNDIILGNIGENFYLNPTAEAPVKLWMTDIDGNGDVDKILTRTIEGEDKPVFLKTDMQEQLPVIKKENLKHADYARKSVQKLFKPELLAQAKVKVFNYASSCIAYNKGGGNFTIEKMPVRAQLSSINSILIVDVNGDEYPDIVSGGNKALFLPQLEKLDASYGDVFINTKNKRLQWLSPRQSGLNISGEVRDIAFLQGRKKSQILFLRNNQYPVLYSFNKWRFN